MSETPNPDKEEATFSNLSFLGHNNTQTCYVTLSFIAFTPAFTNLSIYYKYIYIILINFILSMNIFNCQCPKSQTLNYLEAVRTGFKCCTSPILPCQLQNPSAAEV